MTVDIAITVGLGIASAIFIYASIHMEDEATKFLSYIASFNLLIAALGIMAVGAANVAIVNIIFGLLNVVTGLLVFFMGYFALRMIVEIMMEIYAGYRE